MSRDDSLWKAILEDIFDDFLRFFIPNADDLFDMERGFAFLDKELEQLFPAQGDEFKPKHIDKLVKVFTKLGAEQWFLVHVEVQGYTDTTFEKRMFTYFSRIFDRYEQPITAFAILTDDQKTFRPAVFEQSFYGTTLMYRFNSYKVLDQDADLLDANPNPFAAVILTVLTALKKKKINESELLTLKIDLARRLLAKPFPKDKIRVLMNFLKSYIRFKKPETGVIFEDEYDKLTDRRQTMGIEEYLLYRAEKLGERKGEKKGLKIGFELAKLNRDTLFVTNLLEGSTFTDEEIARFADVSVGFVADLRKQIKP